MIWITKKLIFFLQAALELINSQSDRLLPRGVHLIYERLLTSPTGFTGPGGLTGSKSEQKRVNSTNSFHLSKLLCRRLESSGYHLILGPSHSTLRYAQRFKVSYEFCKKSKCLVFSIAYFTLATFHMCSQTFIDFRLKTSNDNIAWTDRFSNEEK